MRTLNYTVRLKTGKTIETASYSVATKDGNKILKSYLIPKEDLLESTIDWMRERVKKVNRL